jgi:hypothetical protein
MLNKIVSVDINTVKPGHNKLFETLLTKYGLKDSYELSWVRDRINLRIKQIEPKKSRLLFALSRKYQERWQAQVLQNSDSLIKDLQDLIRIFADFETKHGVKIKDFPKALDMFETIPLNYPKLPKVKKLLLQLEQILGKFMSKREFPNLPADTEPEFGLTY